MNVKNVLHSAVVLAASMSLQARAEETEEIRQCLPYNYEGSEVTLCDATKVNKEQGFKLKEDGCAMAQPFDIGVDLDVYDQVLTVQYVGAGYPPVLKLRDCDLEEVATWYLEL